LSFLAWFGYPWQGEEMWQAPPFQTGMAEAGALVLRAETPKPAVAGALAVRPCQTRSVDALRLLSTAPEDYGEHLRERLLSPSQGALHDYELLEMLLLFAHAKGDTKPMAKALINLFGSFANVIAAPQNVLLATEGLDPHGVSALKLVQEAAFRMMKAEVLEQPIFDRFDLLTNYLTAVMGREKIEQFRVLFLNSKNRLLADEALSRGTVNHTPVYSREVVKRALELHATALILAHNHPSGDPTPSKVDIEMTLELKEAMAVLKIDLHDHIIVGNGCWISFRSKGLL